MKVLLIDDEEDIRKIGRLSLERVGKHETFTAASPDEGLDLARRHLPDLILLDMMMPGKDGLTTLAELRRSPETAGIPVVFLTASSQHQEVDRFLAAGALGVIQKPFNPLELPTVLQRLLSSRAKP
jgi:CheY-like chemotaxis protein